MRISFSCELAPKSGKQNFAIRLKNEFKKIGIKVVKNNPDVNLVFVKGFRKGCKNVLRLDGVWMNKKFNCKSKNSQIKTHIRKADGVIYQNIFCKNACDKLCIKSNFYACISNGIDPSSFLNPEKRSKPFFFAACRWRPHKRLKETILGFLDSGLKNEFDLVVAGKTDCTIKDRHVIYLGKISSDRVQNLVASCSGYIHLAYIDWCPNSVVEALVANKPVLHTSSGGTPYLVKKNGVCIKDDEWNFDVIDHYNPPSLSIDEVASGYKKLLSVSPFNRDDLHISFIAKKYIDFIKEII